MYFRYLLLAVSLVLVPHVAPQDDLKLHEEVFETEVVDIKDEVDDVEADVSQNMAQLFEVINDVDVIDELNVAQEERIGAQGEVNSLLQAQLDEQQAQLDELMQIVSSLNTQLMTLDGEVQTLNDTVSDLDIDNSTNERLDALESDVTTLENDVTELDETTDQRLTDLEGSLVDYSSTAFLATISTSTLEPSDPIVFDSAIFNSGGHYDPGTGVYTVPLDGIYQFVLHYRNYEDFLSGAWLEVDGVQVAYTYNYDADTTDNTADLVLLQSLTAGQQVWTSPHLIGRMSGTDLAGVIYSWFSGHLIYAL